MMMKGEFGQMFVQITLNKQKRCLKIRIVELVRNTPAKRTKFTPF